MYLLHFTTYILASSVILLCPDALGLQDDKNLPETRSSIGGQNSCDMSRGHFSPLSGGQCPVGTSWVEKHKCCVKCKYCPPGQRKAVDGCLSGCVPCEEGFFNPGYSTAATCRKCQGCSDKNLATLVPCYNDQDAMCGDCPSGFYHISAQEVGATVDPNEPKLAEGCIKCQEHTVTPECSIYFQSFYKEQLKKQKESQLPWQISTIVLAAILGLAIVSVSVAALLWHFLQCTTGKSEGASEASENRAEDMNGTALPLITEESRGENTPTEGYNPPHADTMETAFTRSPSFPRGISVGSTNSASVPAGLNHISVKVDIPIHALPEIVKYFPDLFGEESNSIAKLSRPLRRQPAVDQP